MTRGYADDPRSSPFLDLIGPVQQRVEPDGTVAIALTVEGRHLNGRQALHGGVLTTLADIALGRSASLLNDPPVGLVTMCLDARFTASVQAGDLVELRTTQLHSTRSTVFAHGAATVRGDVVALFSGVFRKPSGRQPARSGVLVPESPEPHPLDS
jgi:acyl-coenzyme A thioesterase 13